MHQPTVPGTPTSDLAPGLERRMARLERSNRTIVLALVGTAGLVLGAALFGARQVPSGAPQGGAAATPPQGPACKPVSIVLDPSRGSGRWSSTLLAVDGDGKIFMLDTTRAQTFWRPFEFSP